MRLLIRNGHIIDPGSKTETDQDILIEDGTIRAIGSADVICGPEAAGDKKDLTEIDAAGCWVMPGFIDLHVHLRDPGLTEKETLETGALAAAKGGFTTICAMPNTKPVIDSAEAFSDVRRRSEDLPVTVLQTGAVTKGQQGQALAEIEEMADLGMKAISEDGRSVMDVELYRKAMELAAKKDIVVMAHCEDLALVNGGVMNEGPSSRRLGLPGISNESENVIEERDIRLAKETGCRLHLCHCSTKESYDIVKAAAEEGLPVTAEVCPHHFTLSAEDIPGDDADYKMNPPLREKEDVEALRKGLSEGIFSVIATDHAPHTAKEKKGGFLRAPFGITGLETCAGLVMTELVGGGFLTPMQMAEALSYNPAKILKIPRGSIKAGEAADLVIFDPDTEYTVDRSTFLSKGKNTPFDGRRLKGLVRATIRAGRVVYEA